MKNTFLIITTLLLAGTQAKTQTIGYRDPQEAATPTNIDDAKSKGKTFSLPERLKTLSLRVNSSTEFKTKATDADDKEIPLDPSPGNIKEGTATLSFIPNSPTSSGTFKQGTATDASHIIKANITVATKGYFTAHTDFVNGVQFYATGYLEEGQHVLTLKAIGTPIATGEHTYTLNAAGVTTTAKVQVAAGTAVNAATVAIDKTGSNCTNFKIEGNLEVGKELGAENKITLKIKPSAAGYYTISTPVVNGYFYNAALTLANANVQDIVLTGRGTPLASGNNKISVTDGANGCEDNKTVNAATRDFTDYLIVNEVTQVEFTNPDNNNKYTIEIPTNSDSDEADENEDVLLGGASAYEDAIFNTYGRNNLILTPYGLMINTKTLNNKPYIYGGANYVHIFLDEMGNSLITGIPQGMPEVQYVVHVVYVEKSDANKKVSYGIKTTKASFTGISRIENNRSGDAQLTSKGGGKRPDLREYTLVIRTADSDIDFEVYRFENGKQTKGTLSYTIPMTKSFTANISVGLLNSWLKNPTFSMETDPADASKHVAKQVEGNNRGIVTVFATLYTSPITLIKHFVNRKQMKKGQKKLSDIDNPVTNAQLHSKNYLYMRPIWERIYPTIGVGISDKVFQNLFFGLNWEFARGGSFFAGGHFGKVNVFKSPDGFEFEKNNLSQEQFNLYSNKDWRVGWAIGASVDFSIIGNLFK